MNLRFPLILASSSPRRQLLLRETGFAFSVVPSHADETFPSHMGAALVPALLAKRKAEAVFHDNRKSIVLASDTIVILGTMILNKPVDYADAVRMLSLLSGATHTVITAVHLMGPGLSDAFEDITRVSFRKLSESDIQNYIDKFRPFDKAGSYGAQECLPVNVNPCSVEEKKFLASISKEDLTERTMNATSRADVIAKIEGSFFTVMGLPIHLVYQHLEPLRA